ncbi:glycosyltransferase family 47 protein [Calocera cornea HHB12733]|uniref:Glycosyltransferase family 47 protein n=1 Tax=Calocera cornea HHB12733 TaxID=1353952 RepID=A0A165GTG5_9BASI|nr:glycosyltransferase family 47 protein [Calocera cornea HHB12733]
MVQTTPHKRAPFSPRSVRSVSLSPSPPPHPSLDRSASIYSLQQPSSSAASIVSALRLSPRTAVRLLIVATCAIAALVLFENRSFLPTRGLSTLPFSREQPFVDDIVDLPLPGQDDDVPLQALGEEEATRPDHEPSRSGMSRVKHHKEMKLKAEEKLPVTSGLGRVVITGAGGMLGKHLVRRLLNATTPVTLVDSLTSLPEIGFMHGITPNTPQHIRFDVGDVRNASFVSSFLTPDVVGVIHLAPILDARFCLRNPSECADLNERGTKEVVEALSAHGTARGIQPWILLASSSSVYTPGLAGPVSEEAERQPAGVPGKSMLAAERAVEMQMARVGGDWGKKGMHAAILRLAEVYGEVNEEDWMGEMVRAALTHLPVRVMGGQQKVDLLHVDDATDALMLAIKHLTEKAQVNRLTAAKTSLDTFNIGSGDTVTLDTMVGALIQLARSKSPILHLPDDAVVPSTPLGSVKAQSVLGFRPSTWREGLRRYMRSNLVNTRDWLENKLDTTCYAALPNIETNKQFDKLDSCVVQIAVSVHGWLGTLSPEGDSWEVRDKLPGTPLESMIRRSEDGKWIMRLKSVTDPYNYLGLGADNGRGQTDVHTGVPPNEIEWGAKIDWEVEINAELAAIKLILAGTELQLSPPTHFGGDFAWVNKNEDIWPFRLTPTCCHVPPPWPFFAEDPVDHAIEHLRTATVPRFLASIPKGNCERLTKALDKVERDLATLSLDLIDDRRAERTQYGFAAEWSNAGLPVCTNMCDHPMICVDTGDCQCIYSACQPRSHAAYQHSRDEKLSYPSTTAEANPNRHRLVDMVDRSSWHDVLRSDAQHYFAARTPWPKVHVATFPSRLAEWRESEGGWDVDLLGKKDCFSADAAMELAMRLVAVPAAEAEMVFMTYYQQRADGSYYDESWDVMRQTVKNPDPHKVIIPFVHDYGACRQFAWSVFEMRKDKGRDPSAREVVAWTVAGDVNGPCYRPLQDVIIPPRSCMSPDLYDAFEDMSYIRPARQRKTLAGFKGSYWGTGENTRRKVQCKREGTFPLPASVPAKLPRGLQTVWEGLGPYTSYLRMLNDTIFCPTPEGVAGWSPRLSEVIYAGCIPVFIGKASQYPFWDMLDWGKISVTIERQDIQRMEEILMAFSMDEVERMQATLMLVRDAFLYPLDGKHEEQLTKRGPFFYAMHSSKLRMLTKYPQARVIDRPDWT